MEILEKKEEPLLSRVSVKASVVFETATPSNEEVAKQIASALKKDVKLVVVKKIQTHYGERTADIDAFVYDSEQALKQAEPQPKKKEKPGEKAEKKEETKPAEAPKEEKKEEAPKEEKKAE